ncbi:MAG: hypothetical protein ACYSTL_07575 [Planctomycetota bacterium]|jgi:hypothetical protein
MSFKGILAAVVAVGSMATCTDTLLSKYSIEIHVSRIWGENEALPERLTR